MLASILPQWAIDYGTDLIFIAGAMAAFVYVIKRVVGFLRAAKDEVVDDE